jgi:asparagine synthase (glutamine-hydrolysing)
LCGICGIVDFSAPVDRATLSKMTDSIRHRGPDDEGIEILDHAGLGFRRLSIIDLGGSHQPLCNEDGTLWLTFNGEIYNYKDLRKTLLQRGHVLRTDGDGETILHLYEDHGLSFVDHLRGMFALAIWDAKLQRLILARDRLGVKPLYVSQIGDRLAYASETKALLHVPWIPRDLNSEALAAFMNYSTVPGPFTCFESIGRVMPGHVAVFDRSGFVSRPYWDLDYSNQRSWAPGALLQEVEAALEDAIGLRLVSDVPVGVFLSGGIDSSVVAAMASRQSTEPLQAFSIGFDDSSSLYDEVPYARAVAERYGMPHRVLTVRSEDLISDLDDVVWHLDEPCADPSAVLTLCLSRFARQHVKVALSGLGGDEVFGGYRRHLAAKLYATYLKVPVAVRRGVIRPVLDLFPERRSSAFLNSIRVAKKFLECGASDLKGAWADSVSYMPAYDGAIFSGRLQNVTRSTFRDPRFDELWSRTASFQSAVDQVMYVDAKMYFVDARLQLQDKMSMAVGLELREPLVDHKLLELGATIPASLKIPGLQLKALLKQVARKYVPKDCIDRRKAGFAPPLEQWLRGPLRAQVEDLLSAETVRRRGFFNVAFVEWLKTQFYEHHRDFSIELFQAFMLERWFELFVDGTRSARASAGDRVSQP